ncbi:hypothetical protein FPZ12_006865 [Amycolatopsis acidicola]|uniref:Uncharacterized protein n=1 Tax=Amycolatopsis acidicola TaxID=2596893 RepID=A0A5N0VF75_9PSEU|nr:hypothetical protein [Amycolatopsis acidicola]KAA9164966.1 hypothetical protein FPZ12_006865 [Amycolatopsis acidicola]
MIETVLVSALTSGAVALGIEWLAKPRLEARKDRLLDLHRKRRSFGNQMTTIMLNAAKWDDLDLGVDMPESARKRLREERREADGRIEDAIRKMNAETVDVVFSYAGKRIKETIIGYIFLMQMLMISDRTQAEKRKILLEVTGAAHTWLFSRVWHYKARTKAFLTLMTLLRKYQNGVSDSDSTSSDERRSPGGTSGEIG